MFKRVSESVKTGFAVAMFAAIVGCVLSVIPPKDAGAADARVGIFSKTVDVGSLVDGAGETETISVPNAALGDACVASFGVDVQDMLVTCYVQAAGAVEVRVQNESTATVNLASTTMRVFMFPKGTR